VALPRPVEAARHHDRRDHRKHQARRIDRVTLSPDGQGTVIAVTFAGHDDQPRLLRSIDPIATYAVADVDNDGDLDILAASERSGLLLWRNAGRGRFVLASLTSRRSATQPAPDVRHLSRADEGLVAADERYDAAMPRAPSRQGSDPIATIPPAPSPVVPHPPTVPRSGRAPPRPSA
jgi:hypothetical protein